MSEAKDIFLGGTCNGSNWREEFKKLTNRTWFDPQKTAGEWSLNDVEIENIHKREDKYVLFVLTAKMQGAYTVAEAVDYSHKRPANTIFCVIKDGEDGQFDEEQIKSLKKVGDIIKSNGAIVANTLEEIARIVEKEPAETKQLYPQKIQKVGKFVFDSETPWIYQIAQVTDMSNKDPKNTVMCINSNNMEPKLGKSMEAVGLLVCDNGGKVVRGNEVAVGRTNIIKRFMAWSGIKVSPQ